LAVTPLVVVAVAVWLIIDRNVSGLIAVGCGAAGALALVLIASAVGGIKVTSTGFRGHLQVSFKEDSFPSSGVFPSIERPERTLRLGRKGLSGGKLTIEEKGFLWRAGSLRSPFRGSKVNAPFLGK
jgi:hypothetical protein